MTPVTIYPGSLRGTVAAPPSKSFLHRALLCAALSRGVCEISPVAASDDVRATISAVRALGATVEMNDSAFLVHGITSPPSRAEIDCAESGSTLRFLLPVALALGVDCVFTGRGRLGGRPMDAYRDICAAQNILFERLPGDAFRLRVSGRLRSGTFALPGDVSSQYATGLLLALPLLDGDSVIDFASPPESRPYIDMTLASLTRFGVCARWRGDTRLAVEGKQTYRAQNYRAEGDYSQAAVFFVAGALGAETAVSGLKEDSLQGDRAALDILRRMGATVTSLNGAMRVEAPNGLTCTDMDARECPDIVPAMALAMALAKGVSRITHAERLRLKESDRLRAVVTELNRLGARARETPDGLYIEGVEQLCGGATCDCHGDHRIAMMLSVSALHCRLAVTLNDADCVKKSYPDFFDVLTALGCVAERKNTSKEAR